MRQQKPNFNDFNVSNIGLGGNTNFHSNLDDLLQNNGHNFNSPSPNLLNSTNITSSIANSYGKSANQLNMLSNTNDLLGNLRNNATGLK